jgi:hypothetical protein
MALGHSVSSVPTDKQSQLSNFEFQNKFESLPSSVQQLVQYTL